MPLVARDPGIGRDVGDRVLAGEVFRLAQAPVENSVKAVLFLGVTLDGVRHLLFRRTQEMVHLAEHRPDVAHLEHQPLQRQVFTTVGLRQESAGLRREIDQDRARFHHRDRLSVGAFGVDDRGNLAVGIDRNVIGSELVARPDVDLVEVVGKAAFLQHHGNLAPVGRAPGIQFDHFLPRKACERRSLSRSPLK